MILSLFKNLYNLKEFKKRISMRKIFYGLTISSVLATTIFGDVNLSNGLVAHYEFEGNANDSSGNENHGTEHGGVSYVDGVIGKAGNFDGIDNFIEVEHNESLNPINQLSLSLWININQLPSIWHPIIHKGGDAIYSPYMANREYSLWLASSNYLHLASAGDNSGQLYFNTATNNPTNEWFLYTAVIDRVNHSIKAYLNGELVLEEQDNYSSFNNNEENLRIGWTEEVHSNFDFFNGKIDDLRIYNRALSEEEISGLYYLSAGDCPSQITYGKSPKTGTWLPFPTICDVPENWETNLIQPTDFDSETLGIPPAIPIDENTTAIFNAGFKAGIESVENSYSEQNWSSEKVENLSNGWTLNGTANKISDLTVFDSANIVWIFENGVWKAWSSDSAMKNLIETQYELLNEIPKDSGFWIFK
jgi:hypothetical protein